MHSFDLSTRTHHSVEEVEDFVPKRSAFGGGGSVDDTLTNTSHGSGRHGPKRKPTFQYGVPSTEPCDVFGRRNKL